MLDGNGSCNSSDITATVEILLGIEELYLLFLRIISSGRVFGVYTGNHRDDNGMREVMNFVFCGLLLQRLMCAFAYGLHPSSINKQNLSLSYAKGIF